MIFDNLTLCSRPTDGSRILIGGLCIAILLLWQQAVSAYTIPLEPVAPHSNEECDRLYASYRQAADSLMVEASAIFRDADATLQPGSIPWSIAYKPGHQMQAEALNVGSEGSAARNRCMRQVYAYERSKREREEEFQATRNTLSDLPVDAMSGPVRQFGADALGRWLAGQPSPNTGREGVALGTAQGARSVLELVRQMGRIDKTARMFLGGHDLVSGVGYWGSTAGRDVFGWSSLTSMRVKASLEGIISINKAAMEDLQRSFGMFDAAQSDGFRAQLQTQTLRTNAMLGGGGVFGNPGKDDFAIQLVELLEGTAREMAARGTASQDAMAAVAAALAKARRQAADAEEARKRQAARENTYAYRPPPPTVAVPARQPQRVYVPAPNPPRDNSDVVDAFTGIAIGIGTGLLMREIMGGSGPPAVPPQIYMSPHSSPSYTPCPNQRPSSDGGSRVSCSP